MAQPVAEVGAAKNLSASGVICASACQMIGFFVNSQSGGTIVLKDGGASGTALGAAIAPASIGFYRYPCVFGASAYATISGTIDVTFFFAN
mgnify:CR=1 FL=1